MKKGRFALGIAIGGIIFGLFILGFTILLNMRDPLYGQHPNAILNNPKYTIDTIVTTSRHNTVVEYKFVKVEE